ncbi:tetratricopeptide repeat protein [Streptomyces sp. NPDC050504]|uniref:tetratricopeptide repeat protein n=1 Tax=Streptomyces sp. NPDC050504 TaxID=3365618 RepID=UPI0037A19CDD
MDVAKKTALAGLAGAAVLVSGVLVVTPWITGGEAAREPSPVERALTAGAAGAPAALGDLNALIADRRAWVAAHPSDAPAWAALGSAYVERGARTGQPAYYPRAEQALRRSLAVRPGAKGNTDALIGIAALANARHEYGAARRTAEAVRARQPGRWAVYPVLIDAYGGLGDLKAAGRAVEKFQSLRAGAAGLGRAARLYRDRGWREDAAATAAEATARAVVPAQKAECLARQGELAWERGEAEEARGYYDAALLAHPSSPLPAALAGRARALAALGRTDEAVRDYTAAVGRAPRPEWMLELGELYESQGLDGDARTQYARMRGAPGAPGASGALGTPGSPGAPEGGVGAGGVNEVLVLGRYAADHGDAEAVADAVERLRAEWKRGRKSPEVADALGWALYRSGDAGEALPYARRATDAGVRRAEFLYHRGAIERELGMYGAARRHLEEALRVHPEFSPLGAGRAREALEELGEPPGGGPRDVYGARRSTRR